MNDEDARLTPDEEEELIGAVIRRTSGGACRRAEELLAANLGAAADLQVADNLPVGGEADDLALLESHLEHCVACAALARSLAVAREALPSFAAFDPGPSFTAAVLAATSRAEAEELGHIRLKPDATYLGRLVALWNAWLARPRFALEVAYVATILIVVVAGNPASRLQAASEQTVIAAAAGFDRARQVLPAAIARVAPSIEVPASVRALGTATETLIAQRSAASGGLSGAWDRALAQWSVTWGWITGVASDVMARVSGTLTAIRNAVSQWINPPESEPRAPAAR